MASFFEDPIFLTALEHEGVDNWTFYDDSLDELPEDHTDLERLQALQSGGVDNWDGYDFAIERYFDMIGGDPDAEPEEEPETVAPEPVPAPTEPSLNRAERLLLDHLGAGGYAKVRPEFFKNRTHPKQFKKAVESMQDGSSMADAQVRLVELVYKIKAER